MFLGWASPDLILTWCRGQRRVLMRTGSGENGHDRVPRRWAAKEQRAKGTKMSSKWTTTTSWVSPAVLGSHSRHLTSMHKCLMMDRLLCARHHSSVCVINKPSQYINRAGPIIITVMLLARTLRPRKLSAKITQPVREIGLEPKREAPEPNVKLKTIPRSRDFH